MQRSVVLLKKGVVFADQLICTGLSVLFLAEPGLTSFSGLVNLRRQFQRCRAACLLLQVFLMWEFVSTQQFFTLHLSGQELRE